MPVNYAIELDKMIKQPMEKGKRLLLHSCCAPCSSYVLMYLRSYFAITVFYYNPNITERVEYLKRAEEQKKLIQIFNSQNEGFPIEVIEGDYNPDIFYLKIKGLEQEKEGGERCLACFELRLRETAALAKKLKADYFTTTLTISPMKDAGSINEIGENLAEEIGVAFLPSDFKKKDGYKRSIKLSDEYGLYRQDYCGCVYSRLEREEQKRSRELL